MSEFFLKRYREIDPTVELIDPSTIKRALRITKQAKPEQLKMQLRKKSTRFTKGCNIEKIPFLKNGYYYEAEYSLGATPEYLLGQYYLQGPLSQLTCEILKPDGPTLDMAAAPGGKTCYLAEMAPHVVALDNNAKRLATVRNNAERLGLTNVICVKKDARFATDLKETFPFVLLDAPCSGNYCSEEGWFSKRTIEDIKKNARLQRELLKAAYKCLTKGGKLLYSTCSLEPEEDEEMIKWFLNRYEDMKLIKLNTIGDDTDLGSRFWPHKTNCEGFFLALIHKS
ncbi:MAG: RsmB/NOP family class I SAM-dependent RNA methyltransferase [Candidatus Woesearchaeota archaeon]|nr:RsmB/NOP family class I SAM-dependent RNA methyltransferase [Candidatus Woesearchaeota archaeon]